MHVKTWLDGLATSGSIKGGALSTTTVGHARRLRHTGLEKAVGLEILSRNPVHPVRAPTADTGEIEILTADQVAQMMGKVSGLWEEREALTGYL